jgi:hypothetical protein
MHHLRGPLERIDQHSERSQVRNAAQLLREDADGQELLIGNPLLSRKQPLGGYHPGKNRR